MITLIKKKRLLNRLKADYEHTLRRSISLRRKDKYASQQAFTQQEKLWMRIRHLETERLFS